MQFNWQKAPEGFLKWFFTNLMTGIRNEPLWDEIARETDGFQDVVLTAQINGHDVPVDKLIESLEQNTTWQAEQAARELVSGNQKLNDAMNAMSALADFIDQARGEIEVKTSQTLNNLGITWLDMH